MVLPANADSLWSKRKKFFFKPINGYGARAVYRGDKLTKGVWAEILAGSYIAQEWISPGEIQQAESGSSKPMKFDL